MKKSRIMSRNQRTTAIPTLLTLPIDVQFESWPVYSWSIVGDGNDCMFQLIPPRSYMEKMYRDNQTPSRATEFLNGLLAISEPQQLVTFMETYAGPIGIARHPDGTYIWQVVPFHWSNFIEAQTNLRQAMRLPIPKLLRHPEFARFFRLDRFEVVAERRGKEYYGIVTMKPSLSSCYQFIALQRLLANVEYGFCERCGNPYQVTSKHIRKYCDPAICGHAVAQQRYRDKKRND
jgi:hypothetical protein